MDDDDEKEKDISDDENYTGDGEDAYEENNFDQDFQCLVKSATKYFKYQEPLFAFFYLCLCFSFNFIS